VTPEPRIEFVEQPSDKDVEAVLDILGQAAERQHPGGNYRDFGFLLKNAAGVTVGGVTGYVLYQWMAVQYISVAEDLRGSGIGRKLMQEAEAWGRSQSLGGMWLETFAFQAPDFYRKLGFVEFGSIDDHPLGSCRIFFKKPFA
jgi:GNAT superfamily N-acetyltransferase